MVDVFISYASSTTKQAQAVAKSLRASGYEVWRDDDLPVHRPYAPLIEERLRSAKSVLVLWSAAAVNSQWVRAEAEIAREADTLVQVSLDGVKPPLPFNQIQCAALKDWNGDPEASGWKKVIASVAALAGEPARVTSASAHLPLPTKPSLTVLPFSDLSGDHDQAYFADGMLVEIVTALSRFPTLFVIDSNSSLTYRGATPARTQIAQELGVRYLLEGSVRKSDERVRISVQLVDAVENKQVWNERFDGVLEDVFALQDTIANAVAAQILPAIEAAEVRRVSDRPTQDLGAYDLYLRAREAQRSWTKEGLRQAIALLDEAIARDPGYAVAVAFAARCHGEEAIKWSEDPQASRERAIQLARDALHLASDDPDVLSHVSLAITLGGGDLATADTLVERALARNPGSALAWANSGWVKLFGGRAELALPRMETAARLDPLSPERANILSGIGDCLLFLGRFEEAIVRLKEAKEFEPPDRPGPRSALVASLALAGRVDEARNELKLIESDDVTKGLELFRDTAYRELARSGLVLAGASI